MLVFVRGFVVFLMVMVSDGSGPGLQGFFCVFHRIVPEISAYEKGK
jgi:hypothetical protein